MSKEYKITIEDTETGEVKHTTITNAFILTHNNKSDDTSGSHVAGDFISVAALFATTMRHVDKVLPPGLLEVTLETVFKEIDEQAAEKQVN